MADLTDTEIVAACARAMGFLPDPNFSGGVQEYRLNGIKFNPLTDRAQAMELVEKLHLFVGWSPLSNMWSVTPHNASEPEGYDSNLLRAICLCAARVQIEKEKNA